MHIQRAGFRVPGSGAADFSPATKLKSLSWKPMGGDRLSTRVHSFRGVLVYPGTRPQGSAIYPGTLVS